MSKFDLVPEKQALRRREFMAMGAGCSAIAALGSFGLVAETLAGGRLDGVQSSASALGAALHSPPRLGYSSEQFTALVGEIFTIRDSEGNAMAARLKEVNRSTSHDLAREAFSIVFDLDQTGLRQGSYRLTHNHTGDAELFMVPVDLTRNFTRLEAVFG